MATPVSVGTVDVGAYEYQGLSLTGSLPAAAGPSSATRTSLIISPALWSLSSPSPTPGWTFLQWLGDATGTNPVVNLSMTRNKTVQAVFGTTLNTTAAGSGSIVVSPVSPWYPYGSQVRCTAVPTDGQLS